MPPHVILVDTDSIVKVKEVHKSKLQFRAFKSMIKEDRVLPSVQVSLNPQLFPASSKRLKFKV